MRSAKSMSIKKGMKSIWQGAMEQAEKMEETKKADKVRYYKSLVWCIFLWLVYIAIAVLIVVGIIFWIKVGKNNS